MLPNAIPRHVTWRDYSVETKRRRPRPLKLASLHESPSELSVRKPPVQSRLSLARSPSSKVALTATVPVRLIQTQQTKGARPVVRKAPVLSQTDKYLLVLKAVSAALSQEQLEGWV
mmetsp:Transcript_11429/g.22417  ORF Transcript_11429/g.22417 Transcript_11429/m.22417 type:complete len:116 (-) Transcript_11429:288-635(-)